MNRRTWSLHQAWHTEAFSRSKRLKSLAETLGTKAEIGPRAEQTAEEKFANLAAILGVKRKKRKKPAEIEAA